MAKIGLRHIVWSPITAEPDGSSPTYGSGRIIGKAISLNVEVTPAEGELYADDQLAEYVNEFASGNITSELDDIMIQDKADIYGATYSNGKIVFGASDNAPVGGLGGVAVRQKNNVASYIGVVYHKCKAQIPGDSFTTKGNSITFGTQPLNMRIFADNAGEWKSESEPFSTESAAIAWVDNILGVSGDRYKISIQAQGTESGKEVSPVGDFYVDSMGSFNMTITGTPTALYDNSTEKKTSIIDGKYTISNVGEEHLIAVIF